MLWFSSLQLNLKKRHFVVRVIMFKMSTGTLLYTVLNQFPVFQQHLGIFISRLPFSFSLTIKFKKKNLSISVKMCPKSSTQNTSMFYTNVSLGDFYDLRWFISMFLKSLRPFCNDSLDIASQILNLSDLIVVLTIIIGSILSCHSFATQLLSGRPLSSARVAVM